MRFFTKETFIIIALSTTFIHPCPVNNALKNILLLLITPGRSKNHIHAWIVGRLSSWTVSIIEWAVIYEVDF